MGLVTRQMLETKISAWKDLEPVLAIKPHTFHISSIPWLGGSRFCLILTHQSFGFPSTEPPSTICQEHLPNSALIPKQLDSWHQRVRSS